MVERVTEARAALRAFVGVGNVEPWIAQQAWEATPRGWTLAVPLDGWVFRLAPVAGGVRVSASMGKGGTGGVGRAGQPRTQAGGT